MVELTLERIVSLAGDWTDDSRASQQFREIIEDEQTTTEEIESYLKEAIDGSDSYHNRALQDLVNNIGRRLGFEVEYGIYQGVSGTIGYDGHWVSTATDEETHLVVETKKSTAFSIGPEQAGDYMEELVENEGLDREQVYGLYVVGNGDVETVSQTILGSKYRDRMRVITAQRLLDLLEIQADSGLRHDQVVDVLLPINAVDVGQLVGLIQDVIEFREQGNSGDDTSTSNQPDNVDEKSSWDGPKTGANAVQGTISRKDLTGEDDATVAVFPSQKSGVQFLKENNAWGFVSISQNPEYVAMYVSDDVQAVQFVARVKEIVPANSATLSRTVESYAGEQAEFDQNQKVVIFEPGSLYELTDPIPFESRVPYSLRYTELGRLRKAETTDDIL
ncbi:hypothetical protein PM076_07395 [Halorubrum ezzemoulense]|uniref:Restriction endonuclease type IV Mrr domain-containing protein n=1 Tax=Halorubrum ezzemoulense TaxID=337243 RepID=A0ABT4YZ68_HALEZ|nr:hypothetical protein [Halorubrum ezzemoulense]MDB2243299.1 hypothetical protein [Halorubrum ezzemoulense]MDB2277034.1 hypothetical protein [Halorubrum ezzemoulense]MDB2288661.1 hypothetical protein [Halorubrum ezzemoulense]MDB2291214.1 hypothetical protein [Halorubrum ezzemoulense]MDB2296132.1 hypothetical protein [Halorubrum ezzemoulense]